MLRTVEYDALFVWLYSLYRSDNQQGICCTLFRNESKHLSSTLIAEAEVLAACRWPRPAVARACSIDVWSTFFSSASRRAAHGPVLSAPGLDSLHPVPRFVPGRAARYATSRARNRRPDGGHPASPPGCGPFSLPVAPECTTVITIHRSTFAEAAILHAGHRSEVAALSPAKRYGARAGLAGPLPVARHHLQGAAGAAGAAAGLRGGGAGGHLVDFGPPPRDDSDRVHPELAEPQARTPRADRCPAACRAVPSPARTATAGAAPPASSTARSGPPGRADRRRRR